MRAVNISNTFPPLDSSAIQMGDMLIMMANTQGSRRDQEDGGGTGPSSWPRRDREQGGGAGLRKFVFFRFELFLNSSATDIVLVTLPKHGS